MNVLEVVLALAFGGVGVALLSTQRRARVSQRLREQRVSMGLPVAKWDGPASLLPLTGFLLMLSALLIGKIVHGLSR